MRACAAGGHLCAPLTVVRGGGIEDYNLGGANPVGLRLCGLCAQMSALFKDSHGRVGRASDAYSEHGDIARAYIKSGYQAADDKDEVLDERFTSHEMFAAWAMMVPEFLLKGGWHHVESENDAHVLVVHTGSSHPNLACYTYIHPLADPSHVRTHDEKVYTQLVDGDSITCAIERNLLQLNVTIPPYAHVYTNYKARKRRAKVVDGGGSDNGGDDNDEQFGDDDDDDDDDADDDDYDDYDEGEEMLKEEEEEDCGDGDDEGDGDDDGDGDNWTATAMTTATAATAATTTKRRQALC